MFRQLIGLMRPRLPPLRCCFCIICRFSCLVFSKLVLQGLCALLGPTKCHCIHIQRIQLAPPAGWRRCVCLTSFKVLSHGVAKPMRDGMILIHSIEKDRGQTSPRNDLWHGNDTKVRGRITVVKQGHAKFLKQPLCKIDMRSARESSVKDDGSLRAWGAVNCRNRFTSARTQGIGSCCPGPDFLNVHVKKRATLPFHICSLWDFLDPSNELPLSGHSGLPGIVRTASCAKP